MHIFYYPHFSIRIPHPQVPRRSAFYRHLALSWLNTHHVQVLLQRVERVSAFCTIPFCSLKQPDLWQDRFDSWAVKGAMSLFNSFCGNVVKQVARFCCPFYRTQEAEKTREKPTQRMVAWAPVIWLGDQTPFSDYHKRRCGESNTRNDGRRGDELRV